MFKATELKKLEDLYAESGNQLVVLYGPMNCEKEKLIGAFIQDKKFFYYRARKASAKEQLAMMGEEISRQYDVRLQKNSYEKTIYIFNTNILLKSFKNGIHII